MSRKVRPSAWALTFVIMLLAVWFALRLDDPEASGQPAAQAQPRAAGPAVAMPAQGNDLLFTLGVNEPTQIVTWKGEVAVNPGRLVAVEISRGKGKASEGRFSVAAKDAKKKKQVVLPRVRVSVDAPATAQVEMKLDQGNIALRLDELRPGVPKLFLQGKVAVERSDGAVRLTGPETEDDYPALARAEGNRRWLVYNEFQKGKPLITERVLAGNFDELVPTGHGDQLRMKMFDGKSWSPCLDVTTPGLDLWRPSICVDKKGIIHIAWSQRSEGNYDIYHRTFTPGPTGIDGTWSDIVRVSRDPGADFHAVLATDAAGTVWLAWQGWRVSNFHVLVSSFKEGRWEPERSITPVRANNWSPAIAADSKGNVYIAYDSYANDNYDVRLHTLPAGMTLDVAKSPRFEARPHLAVDAQDRVWIAYEEGDEQWGKDYASETPKKSSLPGNAGFPLYLNRTVRVRCLDGGKLLQPMQEIDDACRGRVDRMKSLPRLAIDGSGGVWLSFRHHPFALGNGEVWVSAIMRYAGERWSPPRELGRSENLIDMRAALVPFEQDIMAVYSGDDRTLQTANRDQHDVFAALIRSDGMAAAPVLAEARVPAGAARAAVHANETADVARMRAYRIDYEGRQLHLLRGEFHRHTEYTSHRDQDGLFEDAWRYALDAGRLDWMGDGDHDNGAGHIYMWWQIQKLSDLLNNNPAFIAVQSYERSTVYPNGHRNVIMPKRGIRPLPRGDLKGTEDKGAPDVKVLYAYLKHFGGICASHTSATSMGTDWRDNNPIYEPIVEIYQGHRHNYEHFGAPRSPTKETQIGGYEPKGFIWNAFEKGYKFGFQASSDHVSTHLSYAVVLTDQASPQGLIDAFKQRHCYAATDNIILDVRCDKHLMGDTFTTAQRPTLDIRVRGTAPVKRVSVIRNNKYVYTNEPGKEDVQLRFTDAAPLEGQVGYYYVRVEQTDGNLAWASPMWITYQPK
jgi:hypothetical protein